MNNSIQHVNSSDKRTLIIEDEQDMLDILEQAFKSCQDFGFVIDAVKSKKQAINKIESNHYDVIIIDRFLNLRQFSCKFSINGGCRQ